jgi:hypothetical protein
MLRDHRGDENARSAHTPYAPRVVESFYRLRFTPFEGASRNRIPGPPC